MGKLFFKNLYLHCCIDYFMFSITVVFNEGIDIAWKLKRPLTITVLQTSGGEQLYYISGSLIQLE